MKEHFRQSMAWLHTWTGLVLGWLLFFVFVTGTAGYFDTEIDRWMQPELPLAPASVDAQETVRLAQEHLDQHARGNARWVISLPLDRNDPYLSVFSQQGRAHGGPGMHADRVLLDARTGTPLQARETGGGQQLYRMHWKLHYVPDAAGEWLVGLATMFMLVALVTGIVVHKKIFADFFTFRPGKGQRSWLDAHNVTSVISLPFQLMITYSGLVFLMTVYMPMIVSAFYGPGEAGQRAFRDELAARPGLMQPARSPAALVPLERFVADAEIRWGAGAVSLLDVRHPHDAHARVIVRGNSAADPFRAAPSLVYDGVSGELLAEQPAIEPGAKATRDLLLGLHEGLFAGPLVRWLYFLSGVLGCAMIATGLLLWAVKRRKRQARQADEPTPGLRLVERLNLATVVGLPCALAAYFWANRLLPVDLAGRAAWEVHVLFLAWAVMAVHAAWRPTRRAWIEQLWLAAAAYGLLPVLNALTTGRHLGRSLPEGDWVFAGFDLSMLAFGVIFASLAVQLDRRGRPGIASQAAVSSSPGVIGPCAEETT
ncbi:MAG: PepSY domain-containing protein [Rhodocyclaceae bacterium]|nr:PepSY domain-containing protein [Rhodocyclaceae bacterium]MCL4759294.1 PepSY domain-containing protein [Rhodocyclaceae bacterium]